MVPNLCSSSNDALYLYKIGENIKKGFRVTERTRFPYKNVQRDIISVKNVGGDVIFIFCTFWTLSDHTLLSYKVS